MTEIVDIFPVFPKPHPLVVMPSFILIAYPMGIANEECTDLVFYTKVDHLPGRFMAQITNTPLCPSALLVFRAVQFLPATGILLATGLLFRELSKLLTALMFDGADATSSDNQGVRGRSGDSSQMDFTKIDGGLCSTWGCLRLWNFYANMQLKATIPDQRTGPAILRQIKGQHQ